MDDSASDKSAAAPGSHWLRAHRVLLGVLAGLVLLYALIGFFLVPRIARSEITSYVEQQLHSKVSIGQIQFNPFTLTARVNQFSLTEADGTPIASFDSLLVNAATSSLVHLAWTFQEIRLERPSIHLLIHRNGSLNLAQLAPSSPKPAAAPATPTALPAIRINTLAIVQGDVQYEDQSRDQPFKTTLSPIEFSLSNFRTQPNFQNRYEFSAETAAGEKLAWSGEFSLQPVGSLGEFSIGGLKAATITSYLGDTLPLLIPSGSLDLQGAYRFDVTASSGLTLHLPSIKLHSFALAPRVAAGGSTPWVSLPELDIDNVDADLMRRSVNVQQVTLQKPDVQVWREADGSLNLARLASSGVGPAPSAAPVTPSNPASAAAPAPSWKIALSQLSVQEASIEAEDRSVTPAVKFKLAPLSLTVKNYASTPTQPISYTFDTTLNAQGQLQSQGTVALTNDEAHLGLTLKSLDLTLLQSYVSRETDMRLDSGRLGAQLQVDYVPTPARGQPQLKVGGTTDIADLMTHDTVLNNQFVSWKSVQVSGLKYQSNPDALDIDRVDAKGAYGRVVIGANGSLNITNVLRPLHAETASAAVVKTSARPVKVAASPKPVRVAQDSSAQSASMPMNIRRIDIEDGAANFTDHSVEPNFSSAILGLNGSITGLSSKSGSRAKIDLKGSVDRYAPVSIMGEINVLSAATYADVALSFQNMDLTTFNPYSGKFAGYAIQQGKLTTDLHYHIDSRKLAATHHIVIDQLEFGAASESKQAVPLPIKLAAALLKDRNGVISLDLPVNGSLDDPQFKIGPIVWKLFVGLVTKIVTAPFSWLGSLFGGGEEMSYVDFPAGSSMLPQPELDKLSKLSTALVQRPQLKLDIPLHTAGGGDDVALEHSELEAALADSVKTPSVSAARTPLTGSARMDALTALYRKQFQADPVYPDSVNAAEASAPAVNATPAKKSVKAVLDPTVVTARNDWLEQQLLPKFVPTQDRRDALARARADAAESAVLANTALQPERVFLTERASNGGTDGTARMELKLQ